MPDTDSEPATLPLAEPPVAAKPTAVALHPYTRTIPKPRGPVARSVRGQRNFGFKQTNIHLRSDNTEAHGKALAAFFIQLRQLGIQVSATVGESAFDEEEFYYISRGYLGIGTGAQRQDFTLWVQSFALPNNCPGYQIDHDADLRIASLFTADETQLSIYAPRAEDGTADLSNPMKWEVHNVTTTEVYSMAGWLKNFDPNCKQPQTIFTPNGTPFGGFTIGAPTPTRPQSRNGLLTLVTDDTPAPAAAINPLFANDR